MKSKLFLIGLILGLFFLFECQAQTDTTFVNELGTYVSREQATYYRLIIPTQKNTFLFNDYFFNHQLARSTNYSSHLGTMKEGTTTEYDSLGNKILEGNYQKGFEVGEWIFYFSATTKVKEKRIYSTSLKHEFNQFLYDSISSKLESEGTINENRRKIGVWKTYFKDTNIVQYQNQYINGRKQQEQFEYYLSGSIKRKEIYGKYKLDKRFMFDEKGKKIKYYPAFEYPTHKQNILQYLQKNCDCIKNILVLNDVEIDFWLEKDGQIENLETNIENKNCEVIVKKAILKMKWKPAKKENVPINFKVYQKLKHNGFNYTNY